MSDDDDAVLNALEMGDDDVRAAVGDTIADLLAVRFGDVDRDMVPGAFADIDTEEIPLGWLARAARASCRTFEREPPSRDLLRTLAALALTAPSKSDLQQRDIIIVTDPDQLRALKALVGEQGWTAGVPALVVFCANNRRQRLIHEWRGHAFVNDHLDAFTNAVCDAAIAMATFTMLAEDVGLGTCGLSAIRNRAAEASDILGLPQHVFPFVALAVGWPDAAYLEAQERAEVAPDEANQASVSPRLPLAVTLHENRYGEDGLEEAVAAYDARRAVIKPYAGQRRADALGSVMPYTWSEDKARQYNLPERAGFGAFIRAKGFKLD